MSVIQRPVLTSKTPVELHKIGKKTIHVKRDDLIGDNVKAPPWGKMYAIRNILKATDLSRPIVHLNVWGSWSGWCMSYFAHKMDFEFYMAYPTQKNFSKDYLDIVDSYGGKLMPLKPNMAAVLNGQMRNQATERKFNMLPYAFNHQVYFDYTRDRIAKIMNDAEQPYDNLIVSSGSGVTCTALAEGFFNSGGKNLYTICVSSEKTIKKAMSTKISDDKNVYIHKSEFAFSDLMKGHVAPFPCNELWDLKAWHWLEQNVHLMKGRTLFWNLGGKFEF
jgi:hypothetical protein